MKLKTANIARIILRKTSVIRSKNNWRRPVKQKYQFNDIFVTLEKVSIKSEGRNLQDKIIKAEVRRK